MDGGELCYERVETKQTEDVIPAVTHTLLVLITFSLHDSETKLKLGLAWKQCLVLHLQ